MPSELWLNDLFSLAANTLLNRAKQYGLEVGIFGDLHTYTGIRIFTYP